MKRKKLNNKRKQEVYQRIMNAPRKEVIRDYLNHAIKQWVKESRAKGINWEDTYNEMQKKLDVKENT